MKNRKKPKKQSHNVYAEIFSVNNKFNGPSRRSLTPSQQIYYKIVKHARTIQGNELDQFFSKIFTHPLCPSEINCRFSRVENFAVNRRLYLPSIFDQLIWFKHLFHKNRLHIQNFLILKQKFEINFLNSNVEISLDTLSEIDNSISISLWGIECRGHIKKEILNQDTSDYLTGIKHKVRSKTIEVFLQQMLMKSECKDVTSFTSQLKQTLQEMRETDGGNNQINRDNADMLSSFLIPHEFDEARDVDNRTQIAFTNFSLIDQYLFFKSFVSDKILHGSGFNEQEMKIIKSIVHDVEDEEINSLFYSDCVIQDIAIDYLDIIKSYTLEDYEQCKISIEQQIQIDPRMMSYIELYSRCNIYKNVDIDYLYYQKISQLLKQILLCEHKILESIGEIEKIAVKFHFSSWSIPLLFYIYKFIDEKRSNYLISKKKMKLLGNCITPYSLNTYDFNSMITYIKLDIHDLPEHRKLKLVDKTALDDTQLITYFDNVDKNVIIQADYIKEKAKSLLYREKYIDSLRFFVEAYLINNMNYIILPIRSLLDLIEAADESINNINLSILYDIYSKRIDSNKEEQRLETFQDFIDIFETYKPSEIFAMQELLSQEDLYFLKYVCVPETMDVYPEYGSTYNLKQERINILDLVGEKTDDLDFVEKEKERLLDELIFDQLKIKFDSSKIYVDVESLINKRLDTYKQLFELLLTAQSSFDRTEEYILLEEEELLIPVNDISTVTAKIYYHLLNDFVRNTDYGLDKYLSADIRHGFFVTHMRSGVEKFDLLTDLDENGEYEDYSIWLEKFSLINSSIKLAMNDSLKTFAKEYDTALNEANNWFRISWIITNTQDEKSNVEKPIFDFEPTIVRLDNLKKRIIHIENFDSFMNEILSFMWSITENATIEAKNRLNTVLKPRLDNAFTTLTSSIDECKQNIPLKELLDNISAAHYTMQNDLERILNWFNCMTDDQAQQYNVQNTVKSCIGIFKTRNSDLDIVFNPINSSNHDTYLLTYRETKALMSSLLTALDNAVNALNYIEDEITNKQIHIDIQDSSSSFDINIRNPFLLSPNKSSDQFLSELRTKISDENRSLSTSEGGTGLYKIYNLLSNASSRFSFLIDVIDENVFIATIRISDECIDY